MEKTSEVLGGDEDDCRRAGTGLFSHSFVCHIAGRYPFLGYEIKLYLKEKNNEIDY